MKEPKNKRSSCAKCEFIGSFTDKGTTYDFYTCSNFNNSFFIKDDKISYEVGDNPNFLRWGRMLLNESKC